MKAKTNLSTESSGKQKKSPAELPGPAKAYVKVIQILGLGALAFSALTVIGSPSSLLILALMTALTSCFGLQLPKLTAKGGGFAMTVSDGFVLTGLLLLGPAAAVCLAALDGLVTTLRFRVKSVNRGVFNVAQIALAAFVCGHTFRLLAGDAGTTIFWFTSLVALAAFAFSAVAYFVLSSSIVTVAISLSSGKSATELWKAYFPRLSPTALLNAAAALSFLIAINRSDLFGMALGVASGMVLVVLSGSYVLRLSRRVLAASPQMRTDP